MTQTDPTTVAAADLSLGTVLIHAFHGPGVLVGLDAERDRLSVLLRGDTVPKEYALSVQSIFKLEDGRWVGKAPLTGMGSADAAPAAATYLSAPPALPATAHGVWPLIQLGGLAGDADIQQLIAQFPNKTMPTGRQPPLGCWFNPQWQFDMQDRYLLCDWSSDVGQTVALRMQLATDAQGQRSFGVLAMQPLRHGGYQVTCELGHIAVTDGATEGVAKLLWGEALFYAHLCCFDEHAPYVHAGGRYDWLLSGIAMSIAPADTRLVSMEKPIRWDEVNAKLDTPMQLDGQGQFNLDVSQLRFLMPSEDNSPLAQFRGQVMQVTPCTFAPLVQAVYGTTGYMLELAVLTDLQTDRHMRVRVVCPASGLPEDWQPKEGDWVTGDVWLQAWLWMAEMVQPVVVKKPAAVKPKKPARKVPKA